MSTRIDTILVFGQHDFQKQNIYTVRKREKKSYYLKPDSDGDRFKYDISNTKPYFLLLKYIKQKRIKILYWM